MVPLAGNTRVLPASWTPLARGVADCELVTWIQHRPDVASSTVNWLARTVYAELWPEDVVGTTTALPEPPPLGALGDEGCLLYTSDAADEEDSVDLGGR